MLWHLHDRVIDDDDDDIRSIQTSKSMRWTCYKVTTALTEHVCYSSLVSEFTKMRLDEMLRATECVS